MSHPTELGFRFARLGRDPAFRYRMQACGWTNGMNVYPALPWETEADVRARMDEPGRHLLVVPDPGQPFEMFMQVIEVDK